MKLTLLLYDTTVFSHFLQLSSLYPIWKQLLYSPPFPFEIMLFFPSTIIQNLPLSQLPPVFSTLSHNQTEPFPHESTLLSLWIQKCSFDTQQTTNNDERWIILNPRFLVSQIPIQRKFWISLGEWILSILYFFHHPRPHQTETPLLWLPPPLEPFTFPKHCLSNFLHKLPPFFSMEWSASFAVFSPEVFLSVGNYAPIDWGVRLEWVYRALLHTLPQTEHLIRSTCFHYRIDKHFSLLRTPHLTLSNVFVLPTAPPTPTIPGWEHRGLGRIPVSMIDSHFSLHTWNSLFFAYPPSIFQQENENRNETNIKTKTKTKTKTKKQILQPIQIAWYSWDKHYKEKPPISLFSKNETVSLSVRNPLPITVVWIGYNRFPLFRRALQTFLAQWIDYKKFQIVEYGIAIQELNEGEEEGINEEAYVSFLQEKHHQKFSSTPILTSIMNTQGTIQSLQKLILSNQSQSSTYTLLLTDDWEWKDPFMLEDALRELSPYSNLVWRCLFEDIVGLYKTVYLRQWAMMATQGVHPNKQNWAYAYPWESRVFSTGGSSILRNMGRSWFHNHSYQQVGDSWQKTQQERRKKINYTILTE